MEEEIVEEVEKEMEEKVSSKESANKKARSFPSIPVRALKSTKSLGFIFNCFSGNRPKDASDFRSKCKQIDNTSPDLFKGNERINVPKVKDKHEKTMKWSHEDMVQAVTAIQFKLLSAKKHRKTSMFRSQHFVIVSVERWPLMQD